MAKAQDMTDGNPLKRMLRFAAPLMLCNAFQFLYTIADGAVVGRLIGIYAYGSVAASGTYYWLILSIVLGLTQGFGTLMAQRFGARDEAGLRRAVAMSALLSVGFGAAFSLLGALLVRPLLNVLNTPAANLDGAAQYLHIMVGGMLATFVYNLLGAILKGLGDSRTPLIAMLLASALNIALDVALVALAGLGISGVAIATVASQVFACLYCLRALRYIKEVRLTRADFRIDRATLSALLRLSAPSGLRNFIIAVGGLIMQYRINGYGPLFVAGVDAPMKIYSLMEIIGGAMEGATAVFVAQNYGAGLMRRIGEGVRSARRVLLTSACAIALIVVIFGRDIVSMMLSGSEQDMARVLDVAQNQLYVMAAALPGLYMLFLYRSALTGMGCSMQAMLSGFIELAARVVSVLVLPAFIGEWGVYLAMALGWPMAALQLYISYALAYKKRCARQDLEARA